MLLLFVNIHRYEIIDFKKKKREKAESCPMLCQDLQNCRGLPRLIIKIYGTFQAQYPLQGSSFR